MNQVNFQDEKILIDGNQIEKVTSINIEKVVGKTTKITLTFVAELIGLDND